MLDVFIYEPYIRGDVGVCTSALASALMPSVFFGRPSIQAGIAGSRVHTFTLVSAESHAFICIVDFLWVTFIYAAVFSHLLAITYSFPGMPYLFFGNLLRYTPTHTLADILPHTNLRIVCLDGYEFTMGWRGWWVGCFWFVLVWFFSKVF